MHWKVEGVESHSVSNLWVWGSVGAEALNHAVINIKIKCEGQENNPPHTVAGSQCNLYPAFLGREEDGKLHLRLLQGTGLPVAKVE